MLTQEQYEALVKSSAEAEMNWQKTWGLIHRAGVPTGQSSHYYALWRQLRFPEEKE